MLSRYIELNPDCAYMVKMPEQYKWSSYSANSFGKIYNLITPHKVFIVLGKDHKTWHLNYRRLLEANLPKSVADKIRNSANKSWPVGSIDLIENLTDIVGRKFASETHGGDRKSKNIKGIMRSDSLIPEKPIR